jgi:hypothetical protein
MTFARIFELPSINATSSKMDIFFSDLLPSYISIVIRLTICKVITRISAGFVLRDSSSRTTKGLDCHVLAVIEAKYIPYSPFELKSQRLKEISRRARKYNGSFGTIFQSILDTKNFGTVGSVMLNNAAFRFFLESNDYTQAINEKILSYQGLEQELLLSLKSNRPHYSEIFVSTPAGVGICRLIVNSFGHAICTTDATEVTQILNLEKSGLSTPAALEQFAKNKEQSVGNGL